MKRVYQMGSKKYNKCKIAKPFNQFYKCKNRKDGLQKECKQCQLKRQRGSDKYKRYRNTIRGQLREVYSKINYRCKNPKCPAYKDYGARGIENKFESFEEFFGYITKELNINPQKLTIDRIDNNGNYEYGNIRFVTKAKNNQNKGR